MSGVRVTLPDGKVLEVPRGASLAEIALRIGPGLAKAAIGAFWNGELTALETRVRDDGKIEILTAKSPKAVYILRHSAAHLCAAAVLELFPDAQLGFGPPTEEGFYYDFVVSRPFTPEDLAAIERRMEELARRQLPFERVEMAPDAAAGELARLGYRLKAEYLKELRETDETISFYRNGDVFADMCRGPHVASFGAIPAFKLLSASGAHWRGDAKGIPMQRIHGTAFPTRKELEEHLHRIEEAKRRDHRKLGADLELFTFHDEAPGFPFWHANGVVVWREVEALVREQLARRGYREIRTPLILTDDLWHRSGHYDHYRDNMYFVEKEERSFAVKPMNCPGACLVYGASLHSYRELPLRLAEFGLVHRYELSGVLHGLFRVRGFTQDDAHIYCMPDQIEPEVLSCLEMLREVYATLGFPSVRMKLSTRPKDRMGEESLWDRAEEALSGALRRSGNEFSIAPGDGAFYGPKIDFDLTDSLGRNWQCGTIQLDFQMPERFGLEYVGADGARHRPVMIHRAILGSLERMIGVLVEHHAGRLPFWLAPSQAAVLPITDRFNAYAEKAVAALRAAGLRAEADLRPDKIGAKIRDATRRRIPYLLVAGEREEAASSLAVRLLDGTDLGAKPMETVIEALRRAREARAAEAPELR